MERSDGASTPLSTPNPTPTLLVRLAVGEDAWIVTARCWPDAQVALLHELVEQRAAACEDGAVAVLWLGDVASGASPVAAALVDVDLSVGTATVLAVHPPALGEQLLARLAVGLIEVASSHGCVTIGAQGGAVDPDPGRLLRASGRPPVEDREPPVWSLER